MFSPAAPAGFLKPCITQKANEVKLKLTDSAELFGTTRIT